MVLERLKKDSEWCKQWKIMDYSLLIGIATKIHHKQDNNKEEEIDF